MHRVGTAAVCVWAALVMLWPAGGRAEPNRVPNPNFTGTAGTRQGTTGTVPDQWRAFATGGAAASTSIVQVAAHELFTGCSATNAAKLTVTRFGTDQGLDHDGAKFTITPGNSYHLEFYAKTGNSNGSSQTFKASFPLFNSSGTYLGREPGTQSGLVATSSWKKFVCPTFSDASAVLAHVAFRLTSDGGENSLIIAWPTVGDPPERFTPPSGLQIALRGGWSRDQRTVGTTYFYWYRWPDEHFFDDYPTNTDDALTDHFVLPTSVSMLSKDWHKQQLTDMMDAGIDMCWPVYWAAPGNFDDAHYSRYVTGLVPLQQARAELIAEGKSPPRIGMFYDTSSLLNSVRGQLPSDGKADLRIAEGKEIFYQTIRSFWATISPEHWACIDGRPITLLYASAFAAGYDQSSFDYVYSKFESEFSGVRPFIVRERSWSVQADTDYGWGAALNGLMWGGVTGVGPGYDDSAVPRSTHHYRDRQDGVFYEQSWSAATRSTTKIVHIETWSELHEGTEICETAEYGRQYIDLTRSCIEKFRILRIAGVAPAPDVGLITRPEAVSISFNQLIDAASVTPANVVLTGCGEDGLFDTADDMPVTDGTLSSSTTVVTLDLTNATLPEQLYRVTVHGAASGGIRDSLGGPLHGTNGGSFPTGQDGVPADFRSTFRLTHAFASTDLDKDDDVDQEDFGILQACLSGYNLPQFDSGCERAHLDLDNDVDLDDMMILLGCWTGPGHLADPDCGR